jgi:hypothetical protein
MKGKDLVRAILCTNLDHEVYFFHHDVGYYTVDHVVVEGDANGKQIMVIRNDAAMKQYQHWMEGQK